MVARAGAHRDPGRAAILYDADCGFCRWSTAVVLAWDRRRALRPVALQDPEADALLGGMSFERKMASWHFVTAHGEVHSGGAAVVPLMGLLPGGGPLGALCARFPGATERLYGWVARNRALVARPVSAGAVERADRRIRARAGRR
jgi:predicted DCC family thiol-disulfide oxidoreductase YuxK